LVGGSVSYSYKALDRWMFNSKILSFRHISAPAATVNDITIAFTLF